MSIFKESKIDCHTHVIDPVRFPYGKDIEYKPSGPEIGTTAQLRQVMKTYGVSHSLLVQPNSGYGSDNSCMLDAIAHGEGRFKGVAIIGFDADLASLRNFKSQGIVGAAFNPTFHGIDYYKRSADLIAKLIENLAELDMFLQIQSEHDQLSTFVPWIEAMPIRVLIDHCGRPTPDAGLNQPGFKTLLRLAKTKRVNVKLSGYSKFAKVPYPFDDCWPYVRAIVDAFTLDRCLWASDWPYLRAPQRQDYGPLVELAELLFPAAADRRKLLWDTPHRLFGFGD
ncbi:MAG: 2-pyrone-4,6-dicarboxylate hydrolase [Pseudolabrys sp.]|nr:2-pyrone-4,6-dicarboxylate hydrolase [Pseudolabrys sp.]